MKKKDFFYCILIYTCIYLTLFFISSLNSKSLELYIIKNTLYYLISISIVIIYIVFFDKNLYKLLKITGSNLKKEILVGVVFFLFLSLFTIIPFMVTKNEELLPSKLPSFKILIYFTLFDICIVAPCEEFIFRGYFFEKLNQIFDNSLIANIISSLLFGLLHYPNKKSFALIIPPMIIGFIFTLCKTKIKNCSLISLSIAHGLNNSLITLISYIFT